MSNAYVCDYWDWMLGARATEPNPLNYGLTVNQADELTRLLMVRRSVAILKKARACKYTDRLEPHDEGSLAV